MFMQHRFFGYGDTSLVFVHVVAEFMLTFYVKSGRRIVRFYGNTVCKFLAYLVGENARVLANQYTPRNLIWEDTFGWCFRGVSLADTQQAWSALYAFCFVAFFPWWITYSPF